MKSALRRTRSQIAIISSRRGTTTQPNRSTTAGYAAQSAQAPPRPAGLCQSHPSKLRSTHDGPRGAAKLRVPKPSSASRSSAAADMQSTRRKKSATLQLHVAPTAAPVPQDHSSHRKGEPRISDVPGVCNTDDHRCRTLPELLAVVRSASCSTPRANTPTQAPQSPMHSGRFLHRAQTTTGNPKVTGSGASAACDALRSTEGQRVLKTVLFRTKEAFGCDERYNRVAMAILAAYHDAVPREEALALVCAEARSHPSVVPHLVSLAKGNKDFMHRDTKYAESVVTFLVALRKHVSSCNALKRTLLHLARYRGDEISAVRMAEVLNPVIGRSIHLAVLFMSIISPSMEDAAASSSRPNAEANSRRVNDVAAVLLDASLFGA